jgi:hypothetical protein
MRQSSEARQWTLEPGLLKTLTRICWLGLVICAALVSVDAPSKSAKADPLGSLGLPVSCILGTECFVQQMPDIDPSSGVLDPLCRFPNLTRPSESHDNGAPVKAELVKATR